MTAPRRHPQAGPPAAERGGGDRAPSGFKGNKQALPSKPCVACGRPMSWRKRWARTWDAVKYCSEACRRAGPPAPAGAATSRPGTVP